MNRANFLSWKDAYLAMGGFETRHENFTMQASGDYGFTQVGEGEFGGVALAGHVEHRAEGAVTVVFTFENG